MTKEELLALGVEEETATKIIEEQSKNFIPKYRYNEVAKERDNLKEQVTDRDKQLTELSKNSTTIEELNKQVKELTETNKTKDEEHKKELAKIVKENAIAEYLTTNKVKNVEAVKKLLDYEKITKDDKGLQGIEEQFKTLKEDESLSSLFEVEEEKPRGIKPVDGNGQPLGASIFDVVLKTPKENEAFNPWA